MKYSVLTYIFGGGELLREAPKDPNIEYICVTDDETLQSDSWTIVVDEDLKDYDSELASFYVRYHPFKYCSGDICIRIDGSIQINKSLLSIFKEFEDSGNDICVMTNSRALNIALEMCQWPGYKKVLTKQLDIYKQADINILKFGSLQSTFSIVRNNDVCNECDNVCWNWIDELANSYGTVRPSQALMTAAVHLTSGLNLMFVTEDLIQSDYMQWCHHNSEKTRKSKHIARHTKFFNKPVEIHSFE